MLAFGPLFACCVRRGVGRRQPYVARWPDVRYSATATSCPPVVVVTPVFFAVAISMEQCDVLGTDALLEDDDIAIAVHLVALSFSHTPQSQRRARARRGVRYFRICGRKTREQTA